MSKLAMTLSLLSMATCLVACELDQPCGPELVLDRGFHGCVRPPAPDAGFVDAGTLDASDPMDGGSSEAMDATVTEDASVCADPGYGTECSVAGPGPECPCEADFCALQPGMSTGFCTRTGCLPPDAECPAGYQCMDLTTIAPQLGSICVRG